MSKLNVLLIVEAANPEWVSVPLVGWSISAALCEVANVHVVTQVRNRDAIVRAGWVENEHFTAIDTEAFTRPIWRLSQMLRRGSGKGWTLNTAVNSLLYPYFERLIWKKFGPAIRAGQYDVVHRITPVTLTAVSPLAKKCKAQNVPFVIGPLNGGVPWPAGFDKERREEGEWLSYFRGIYKFMPGRKGMFAACKAILVGSQFAADEIPSKFKEKVIWLPENAIDRSRFNLVSAQNTSGPIRGCVIGRLVPCKGINMLLEAAADHLREGRMVLDVVGDGPLKSDLEEQARALGISEAVTFHGQVPHQDVQKIAVQANLLTFPSIREFGGGVVLEAMALGVVPLVVDYAGPGELVTKGTGLKVAMGSRSQIISDLRAHLDTVIADPSVLPELAKKAYNRAHEKFTWEAKANQILDVYDWVLQDEKPAPDLIDE